jgi:hypothetical protein
VSVDQLNDINKAIGLRIGNLRRVSIDAKTGLVATHTERKTKNCFIIIGPF